LLMAVAMGFCASVNAASMKDLTLQALSSGSASGELDLDIQKAISTQTKSNEPVFMEITTVKQFAQEGCARLQYVIHQEKVLRKSGELAPFKTDWQINICQDGSPPSGE